ncbi:hypothetical protein GCM10009734_55640 [Nonomuraea bangladeshensis]
MRLAGVLIARPSIHGRAQGPYLASSSRGRKFQEGRDALSGREKAELAGVATDGTADTLEVDVASTDEHGVRWHAFDDTLGVRDVQDRVQSVGLSELGAGSPG